MLVSHLFTAYYSIWKVAISMYFNQAVIWLCSYMLWSDDTVIWYWLHRQLSKLAQKLQYAIIWIDGYLTVQLIVPANFIIIIMSEYHCKWLVGVNFLKSGSSSSLDSKMSPWDIYIIIIIITTVTIWQIALLFMNQIHMH